MKTLYSLGLTPLLAMMLAGTSLLANDWSVPLAGNAFRSQPEPGSKPIRAGGGLKLNDVDEVYSVYFHVDRPGSIHLAAVGHASEAPIEIEARVGDTKLSAQLQGALQQSFPLGEVNISKPGYVRVDLQRLKNQPAAATAAVVDALLVSSDVDGMTIDYVRNNEGNMFYWGRRGPSVHLNYQLPQDTKLCYAYSELFVPVGQDPIGSYFMANGFGEGYFGIQVNSPSERRVLFSVWSPFHTDNPADIPVEDRIVTLVKGEKVHAQDFGNEGSGGQSYLVYPWQSGVTYRFLTEVKPDGQGNTLYTSWFGDKQTDEWRLLASFRRPKTDKYLSGFHSFLESFSPEYGNIQRSAQYGNQWVCDVDGAWHEITRAKFTGDNTARRRQRLDYAGGSDGDKFFLRNCGFFDSTVALDTLFTRASSAREEPAIGFDALPRK